MTAHPSVIDSALALSNIDAEKALIAEEQRAANLELMRTSRTDIFGKGKVPA